ncbi:hypothetical protein CU098_008995 [Rhizopus stolonifer]|uniref:Uncharacterized protein n=1 Tax=Rhizopus stolonifer TaxID=4846 RepID=A0A367JD83_RHIST|nr:hypothetical protein CU098_008995 [Rhizopus stolonifer]
MPPPKVSPISLIYSEQEIWTRLAIREFLFRFGHLYQLDTTTLTPLQNVQGDWRMKRLGATLVWKCLVLLTTGSFDEQSTELYHAAKGMIRQWIEEHDLPAIYNDTKDQEEALLKILQLEGMSAKRWKDVAGLIDSQEKDVMKITLCLLELLLFEEHARQSFSVVKETHKQEIKEFQTEETKKKSMKYQLTDRIQQLKSFGKDDRKIAKVREQLEQIETEIRDDCTSFHQRQIEYSRQSVRSNKRMQSAGRDRLGNEYWIFSDLMEQACRNKEPYWAFGIIVIGPGYEDGEVGWWAIEGRKEMEKLSKWLKWHHDQEVKNLVESIQQRIDYLYSLEWAVYGQGFFS